MYMYIYIKYMTKKIESSATHAFQNNIWSSLNYIFIGLFLQYWAKYI